MHVGASGCACQNFEAEGDDELKQKQQVLGIKA